MNPPIRAIATDLDGTLLNDQHMLSPRTERALREAMARGVHVIFATGKTRFSSLRLISSLGLTSPGVYVQGSIAYKGDGTVLAQRVLPAALAVEGIKLGRAAGVMPFVISGTRNFTELDGWHVTRLRGFGEDVTIYPDLCELPAIVPVHKVFFSAQEPSVYKTFRPELTRIMAGQASIVQAVREVLEILPLGTTKGAGVRSALDFLGIAPEETLALGDGENDIEMVQQAGIGVAVGNAYHRLKDYADAVVATNQDDGASEAIERYVLGG